MQSLLAVAIDVAKRLPPGRSQMSVRSLFEDRLWTSACASRHSSRIAYVWMQFTSRRIDSTGWSMHQATKNPC